MKSFKNGIKPAFDEISIMKSVSGISQKGVEISQKGGAISQKWG
jgi:hypothetical protein